MDIFSFNHELCNINIILQSHPSRSKQRGFLIESNLPARNLAWRRQKQELQSFIGKELLLDKIQMFVILEHGVFENIHEPIKYYKPYKWLLSFHNCCTMFRMLLFLLTPLIWHKNKQQTIEKLFLHLVKYLTNLFQDKWISF